MAQPLVLSLPRPPVFAETRGSPVLPVGRAGIAVHAAELGVGPDAVAFTLRCAYQLPAGLVACFRDLPRALLLFVDDPAWGRAGLVRLEDTYAIEYPAEGAGYDPARAAGNSPGALCGGWVSAVVEVRDFARRPEPTLYARVALHAWVSPVLELGFRDRAVRAFTQGEERALELSDLAGG